MKVVLISSVPFVPVHEGNQSRILSLSRAIRAQGHDLWVVLLPAGIWAPGDAEAHRREFGVDRFVELSPDRGLGQVVRRIVWTPFRLWRRICRKLGLPAGYYTLLDEYYRGRWSGELADLHRQHRFDVAMVEYVLHSAALEAFPAGVRKVIDTHDALADRHRRYLARGLKGGYWFSLRPAAENRGFRRADALIAIQHEEAEAFQAQLGHDPAGPEIALVSHFLDLSSPPVADHAPRRALFLASANSANRLSAQMFVRDILPLILGRVPDFRLVLAGAICGVVDDHPAVMKLGRVDSPLDAFAEAPLLVNPMVVGTGINIKLLDALAAGVPVVSTDTGARGLPEAYRGGVLTVAEDDHGAFASYVVELMGDEERRRRLGAEARKAALAWNDGQLAALRGVLSRGSAGPSGAP